MRLLFLYILLLVATCIQSQGFKVRHYVPNASSNSPKALFEVSPGNYIGAGFAVDTSSGQPNNTLAIVGLGSQGQLLWTKKYKGHKIKYYNNGFIQRCFYKKDNFLYYAGVAVDTAGANIGVFIKFDLNGDTLWHRTYKDTVSVDLIPQMVTASVDGGFLITGFFQDWINHTQQGLILKTDANGNELWRKKINKLTPNVQDGKAIVQDSVSKKIAIVGAQYMGNNEIHDNILILDSLGNKLTENTYGYIGGWATDLIQTQDKKMIMVGWQFYTETIGGNNCQRSFAVKFDINNPTIPIWKIDGYDKLALYNGFTCVTELKNGDILMGGYMDTIQSVWNGPNNQPGNMFTRLTVVDKDGHIKWNRYYDYKRNAPSEDNLQGIHTIDVCADGGWLAAIEDYNYQGTQPFLFVRYDSNGCDSTVEYCTLLNEVGLKKQVQNEFGITFYPNPVSDYLIINSYDKSLLTGAELSLKDVFGRELQRIKPEQMDKIDFTNLDRGVYFLVVYRKSEQAYTTKIIKE